MPSDAEILAGCRAGDRRAWAALVDRHGPSVLAALGSALHGRSRQEIEDLSQETWARILEDGGRRLERVDPDLPFGPWIVTVALNLARRRLRSVTLPSARIAPAESPLEILERRDELEAALEGMRALSPRDRLVLEMAAVEGLPEGKMAEALGVAPASVHSLLARARRRLASKS